MKARLALAGLGTMVLLFSGCGAGIDGEDNEHDGPSAGVTSGALRVSLAPAEAVAAGARWRLDASSTTHASGETVSGLATGTHTIHFAAVAGYNTPADQTVTVSADQTATAVGTYGAAASSGALQVNLAPAGAVAAGARWLLDGSATQHTSGETVNGLAAGSHTVRFTAVAGYNTPADQTVTVTANQTASATGTYGLAATTGSIQANLAPPSAVSAGARWTLDSSSTQHLSGETVAGVATGSHTVHFTAVSGYATPADQTVTVNANQTAVANATYGQLGSVTVTLTPAGAVSAGARWTLDGSATTHASGDTVGSLTPGAHLVGFGAATGYTTPADRTVTVTAGQNTAVSQAYSAVTSLSFATSVRPVAQANCSCHGSTMTTLPTLLSSGRVVPGNAANSSYVTKSSMQGYWGSSRQTVIDWINQGANP